MQYILNEAEYEEYMLLKKEAGDLPVLKEVVAWAHSVLKPKNCGTECSCDMCIMSWCGCHFEEEGIEDWTDREPGKHGVPSYKVSRAICKLYRNYSK